MISNLKSLKILCRFSKSTRHFTQMIWSRTFTIGCGSVTYRSDQTINNLVVCNYGPGNSLKNFILWNITKIYIKKFITVKYLFTVFITILNWCQFEPKQCFIVFIYSLSVCLECSFFNYINDVWILAWRLKYTALWIFSLIFIFSRKHWRCAHL